MELAWIIGLLVVGFIILIKGAALLVDGGSALAKGFNISNMVIGLTVVAFGTSMPELVVSGKAALAGDSDMMMGNVLGSNIYNIVLILGTAGLIYPLVVQKTTLKLELPFSILNILLLFVIVNDVLIFGADKNDLSKLDALILLIFFSAFLYYIYKSIKNEASNKVEEIEFGIKRMPIYKSVLLVVLGLVALIYGGDLVVTNAKLLAATLGMSDRVIALTIVAIGTSMPEYATSVVAAFKKNSDIAVGNVVGSNIFNALFILGASAMMAPSAIEYNTASNFDMYVLLGINATLILLILLGQRGKAEGGTMTYIMNRWQSGVLFLIAAGYTWYLIKS